MSDVLAARYGDIDAKPRRFEYFMESVGARDSDILSSPGGKAPQADNTPNAFLSEDIS